MSSTPLPVLSVPQTPVPSSKTNIVFIIVIIIIVVLIIFMFTKMNTMNKELKEVRNEVRDLQTSAKMIQAIGQKLGLALNEKGEIVDAETEDDQEDNGEACELKRPAQETGAAMGFDPATMFAHIPPDLMATLFAATTQPAARVEEEDSGETGVEEVKPEEKESVKVD